jgi:uncharacterized protein (TIGR03435 family)
MKSRPDVMRLFAILSSIVCAAWAQHDAAPPAFEVASVKVVAPYSPESGRAMIMSGCAKPDPATVRCNNANLKTLLMRAYDVKDYQIQGPAWMDSDGYDLMAKVPDGVPADKIPAMLQALLADRFGVRVHKESRVLPAYELSVAKGGPKLKEADTTKLPSAPEPGSELAPPPRASGSPSPSSSLPVGFVSMTVYINGSRTIRGIMTAEQLARHFTRLLDRPVFDNTGLKGTYQIELSYLGDEIGGGRDDAPRQQDANAPVATLFQAAQQTLGLKLDAKKSPVEMIVVESANRVPTEN